MVSEQSKSLFVLISVHIDTDVMMWHTNFAVVQYDIYTFSSLYGMIMIDIFHNKCVKHLHLFPFLLFIILECIFVVCNLLDIEII